jgi:hypothetical protein
MLLEVCGFSVQRKGYCYNECLCSVGGSGREGNRTCQFIIVLPTVISAPYRSNAASIDTPEIARSNHCQQTHSNAKINQFKSYLGRTPSQFPLLQAPRPSSSIQGPRCHECHCHDVYNLESNESRNNIITCICVIFPGGYVIDI